MLARRLAVPPTVAGGRRMSRSGVLQGCGPMVGRPLTVGAGGQGLGCRVGWRALAPRGAAGGGLPLSPRTLKTPVLGRPGPPPPCAAAKDLVEEVAAEGGEARGGGAGGGGAGGGEDAMSSATARLLLLGVALLWGTYGPSLRYMFSMDGAPTPFVMTALRGSIASALLLPQLLAPPVPPDPAAPRDPPTLLGVPLGPRQAVWLAAGELGLYNFTATTFQSFGLETTSATRAGFLIQATALLTPLLAALTGERVPKAAWLGCALGVVGGALMAADGAGAGEAAGPGGSLAGDALVLCGAGMYALLTVRLGVHARRVAPGQLAAAKTATFTAIALAIFAAEAARALQGGAPLESLYEGWRDPAGWGVIFWSGLGPGALAAALQARGQRALPAAEAQVMYSFTPFFSAILAAVLLKEVVGTQTLVGGGIIVSAGLLAAGGDLVALARGEGKEDSSA